MHSAISHVQTTVTQFLLHILTSFISEHTAVRWKPQQTHEQGNKTIKDMQQPHLSGSASSHQLMFTATSTRDIAVITLRLSPTHESCIARWLSLLTHADPGGGTDTKNQEKQPASLCRNQGGCVTFPWLPSPHSVPSTSILTSCWEPGFITEHFFD